MKKAEEIMRQYMGLNEGKIQALEIKETPKGTWKLKYRDDTGIKYEECDDYNTLNQILVTYGGKNPETCKAPEMFLDVDGSWTSKTLRELGHNVTKINVHGQSTQASNSTRVNLPQGSGEFGTLKAKKTPNDTFKINFAAKSQGKFTRSFSDPKELDVLLEFLLQDDTTKELKWKVNRLHTQSNATGKQCVWERNRAGDGTNQMVLELVALDSKPFHACVRQDLFDAADGMFDQRCVRVKTKKVEQEKNICEWAVEKGNVDLSNYEAST
jgi:hypothetical protein